MFCSIWRYWWVIQSSASANSLMSLKLSLAARARRWLWQCTVMRSGLMCFSHVATSVFRVLTNHGIASLPNAKNVSTRKSSSVLNLVFLKIVSALPLSAWRFFRKSVFTSPQSPSTYLTQKARCFQFAVSVICDDGIGLASSNHCSDRLFYLICHHSQPVAHQLLLYCCMYHLRK